MKPNQKNNPQPSLPDTSKRMALFSVFIGLGSILMCVRPDLQFGASVAGILFAIYSKNGKPFSGLAIFGLIISITSLILSLFMFAYFCLMFTLAKDPQFAPIFNEAFANYEKWLESIPK